MKEDESRRQRREDRRLSAAPVLETAGILALFIIVFLIPIVFLFHADKLGIWWTVLLVTYLVILCGIYWVILHRRRMLDLRGLMGNEAFYAAFPKEKVWDERFARFHAFWDRLLHRD